MLTNSKEVQGHKGDRRLALWAGAGAGIGMTLGAAIDSGMGTGLGAGIGVALGIAWAKASRAMGIGGIESCERPNAGATTQPGDLSK